VAHALAGCSGSRKGNRQSAVPIAYEYWERSLVRTRIGFDHYTIAHRGFTARQTLEFAQAHHFDGVQFLEPTSIDPRLDHARLSEFRRQADAMGLYLEIGLPSPNPAHRSRELDREVAPAELAQELLPHVEAVAALSCRHARVFVGNRHDRFRADNPWSSQIEATIEVIDRLTPALKSLGIRLAIETHADLTGDELIALLGRIDPDVAGVTLDTGNIVMRLDDPVELARRLAPYVVATHVKDAVLAFTPRGLCWQARPVGSGIMPLPDILAVLLRQNPAVTLSIELHPRTYDLPIHDDKWLSYFPGLRPLSLAAVVRLAALAEERYLDGSLEPPETIEAVPWPSRDLDWLASSLGYLRSVVPTLAAI
jgi:sugar phosphate isomerase/epimerase